MAANETPKAAAAFADYCALGTARSLQKLAKFYGKTTAYVRQLEQWSSQHNWQERVRQYDQERADERAAAIEEMNIRQAELGVEQTRNALAHIAALMEDDRFGSQAVVMLLKLAIETERTARGAPASVQRQEVSMSGELAITDARTILATRLATVTGQTPPSRVTSEPA